MEEGNNPINSKEELEQVLSKLKDEDVNFDTVFKKFSENCSRPYSYSIDPRDEIEPGTGTMTVYTDTRYFRPDIFSGKSPCLICQGNILEDLLIMSRKLSSGSFAFAQANQYAFLNPDQTFDIMRTHGDFRGINFLVWPSTSHEDIREISPEDHVKSFDMISEIEKRVLFDDFNKDYGFIACQVVKNIGSALETSHVHGPYHVAIMNKHLKRIYDDIRLKKKLSRRSLSELITDFKDFRFKNTKNISFIKFFQEKNNPNLLIKDYGSMVLAIPYFMKRPLEAIIYPKNNNVQWFGELNQEQKVDLAKATSDVSYALSLIMPSLGKIYDCNIAFHTGPIGTIYAEVFTSTQRPGGYERLRFYVCEGTQYQSAEVYKRFYEIFLKGRRESRYDLEPTKEVSNYIRKQIIEPIIKRK